MLHIMATEEQLELLVEVLLLTALMMIILQQSPRMPHKIPVEEQKEMVEEYM